MYNLSQELLHYRAEPVLDGLKFCLEPPIYYSHCGLRVRLPVGPLDDGRADAEHHQALAAVLLVHRKQELDLVEVLIGYAGPPRPLRPVAVEELLDVGLCGLYRLLGSVIGIWLLRQPGRLQLSLISSSPHLRPLFSSVLITAITRLLALGLKDASASSRVLRSRLTHIKSLSGPVHQPKNQT